MPLPINISQLIKERVVESSRIDYKAGWNPEAIVHTICAFANDIDNIGGGYIVIGVAEDNGTPLLPISGLDKASIDSINKDIIEKCNLIEPRYLPIVSNETFEGKDIIVIWAPGGESRPYRCPVGIGGRLRTDKACYIRKASSTVKANSEDERRLFSMSQIIPFDDRANTQARVQDIDPFLITGFLDAVGSSLHETYGNDVLELSQHMGLISGPPEHRVPRNIALMFFNPSPERFFPFARIEFVDKPTPEGDLMQEKVFTGPLDRQLTAALQYIRGYVLEERIEKNEGKAEATRFYNYPFAAIEEALANAVYHKSYEIREPIVVTLTPYALEIKSCPGPDGYITDEDLEAGTITGQVYRNRRIGDYLKELKLAEGRNTGIAKIRKAMERNGSSLPIFQSDSQRRHFSVILPVHEAFLPKDEESRTSAVPKRSRQELKKEILVHLADNGRMSIAQLSSTLGYAMPPSSLRKAVKELLDEGRIEYTSTSLRAPDQQLRLRI